MAAEEAQPKVTIKGVEYTALGAPKAEGKFDYIVVGTGIQACLIGCIMARGDGKGSGKCVLQIDRNNYYGSEGASLTLTEFYQKFTGKDAPADKRKLLGRDANWSIDQCPKFLMAGGKLVKLLIYALGAERVSAYNEYASIEASYVYHGEGVKGGFFGTGMLNHLFKVPATPVEAAQTALVGFFQKRKLKGFLQYVASADPKTDKDLQNPGYTAKMLYAKCELDAGTQDFVGHSMGLFDSDEYLSKPAVDLVNACQLYIESIRRFGKSPYLYPVWGNGTLPQSFARVSAMYGEHNGGTFMLGPSLGINPPGGEGGEGKEAKEAPKKIEFISDDDGKVIGVKVGDQAATAPVIVAEPDYFKGTDKVKTVGKVIRSICILDHPVAYTDNNSSCQIIMPQSQIAKGGYPDRSHDIYITVVSNEHSVASKGFYIAIVSTQVETGNPIAEVKPAIDLLGKIVERFDSVTDMQVPVGDGKADNCFICDTYSEAAHFEDVSLNTIELYKRITGEELDMSIKTSDALGK